MTFSDIKGAIKDYCNLSSSDADTRVGKAVNRHYRRITSSLGLDVSRFVTRSTAMSIGVQTVTFTSIEKIDRILNTTDATAIVLLQEVSIHEIRSLQPGTGPPTRYAIQNTAGTSVTVLFDVVPQSAYSLQADGWATVADLTGTDVPVFPESYHDILAWSVISEELLKKEKPQLAQTYAQKAQGLLNDLRFFLADSHTRETVQGGATLSTLTGGGSSGTANQGGSAYTQTGLVTFDRDPSAPFAVTDTSAYVPNLFTEGVGNVTTDRLIGRDTAGTGESEQLTVGGGLEFTGSGGIQTSALTGDVTKAAGGTALTMILPGICHGRLTLTSGTAVTTADVTGATTIYFTPYKGNKVALYDGSTWALYTLTERALALGTLTSGLPYDVFLYNNSGTLTLELLAWTNDNSRATALATQDGVLVKTGATTRRYLGTLRTTSTTATEDSLAKRFLWNYYNRVRRPLQVLEATDSWTYTTATWRQANGAAGNQIDVVVGVAEVLLEASVVGDASNTNAGVIVRVSIGYDSTSAPHASCLFALATTPVAAYHLSLASSLRLMPAIGRHLMAWLEFSGAGVGTTTWYGDNGATLQAGILGTIEG